MIYCYLIFYFSNHILANLSKVIIKGIRCQETIPHIIFLFLKFGKIYYF